MKKEDIITNITAGIHEVFPESAGVELKSETLLEEVPDWDSMASVNLQLFLEEAFGCSVPTELLSGETSIGDLVEHIQTEELEAATDH